MSNVEHAMRHMRRANELLKFGERSNRHHESFGVATRGRSPRPQLAATPPPPTPPAPSKRQQSPGGNLPATRTLYGRIIDYVNETIEDLNWQHIYPWVLKTLAVSTLIVGAVYEMNHDQRLTQVSQKTAVSPAVSHVVSPEVSPAGSQKREEIQRPLPQTVYSLPPGSGDLQGRLKGRGIEGRRIMVVAENPETDEVIAVYHRCEQPHDHEYPESPLYPNPPLKYPHGHCRERKMVTLKRDELNKMKMLPDEVHLVHTVYTQAAGDRGELRHDDLVPFSEAAEESGDPHWRGTLNMKDEEEVKEEKSKYRAKYGRLPDEL